jgi:RNA polymerase sigma-70 factor (ECF subfamily)
VVLVKLTTALRGFQYDLARRFRAWLKTVTRHAWSDFLDERRRNGIAGAEEARFTSLAARDDLELRLANLYDQERLQLAMAQVRPRVDPHTWEAFHLTAVEGLTGTQAASRLSIPVASLFVAKHRVLKMLCTEVRRHGDED